MKSSTRTRTFRGPELPVCLSEAAASRPAGHRGGGGGGEEEEGGGDSVSYEELALPLCFHGDGSPTVFSRGTTFACESSSLFFFFFFFFSSYFSFLTSSFFLPALNSVFVWPRLDSPRRHRLGLGAAGALKIMRLTVLEKIQILGRERERGGERDRGREREKLSKEALSAPFESFLVLGILRRFLPEDMAA